LEAITPALNPKHGEAQIGRVNGQLGVIDQVPRAEIAFRERKSLVAEGWGRGGE